MSFPICAELPIGFIFQSFNLIPVLTVFENIEYPLLLNRTPSADRRLRVGEIIESLGLAGMASRRPAQLSGGAAAACGDRACFGDSPQTCPR